MSLDPIALDQPSDERHVVYPGHIYGPHPGFLQRLAFHPPWDRDVSNLAANVGYEAPALSVRVYENAILSRLRGIAIDTNGILVEETLKAQRYIDPQLQNVPDISVGAANSATLSEHGRSSCVDVGESVFYANHGGYTVFGHYLFETLASIWAMRTSFSSGKTKILLPYSSYTWPLAMLDVAGVPEQIRIQVNSTNIRCKTLAVSSSVTGEQTFFPMPGMRGMVEELKKSFGAQSGKLRLYITRQGAQTTTGRFVANEMQVIEGLKTLGFQPIEPGRYSFDQQVRIFSQAEAVIGVHGSAFANTIFCPPEALVVDLLPDQWAHKGGRWIKNMTHNFGHNYFYILCRSQSVSGRGIAVNVDVPLVLERLQSALGGA